MALEFQEIPVTVNVGSKSFSKTYKQIVRTAVNGDDILKMLEDPKQTRELINDWHYGQDLRAKAEVRNAILNDASSAPEVAFEKNVKALMDARAKNGKPLSLPPLKFQISATPDP